MGEKSFFVDDEGWLRRVVLFLLCSALSGFSGTKCEISAAATTVAPALKCSDCVSTGTEYCTSSNGLFSCKCKAGDHRIKVFSENDLLSVIFAISVK